MSKKAAIYVRVSTEEQAERGTSIENQLECLRAHCAAHKIEIYDEYKDPGVSGGTLDRPGLNQLLQDAEKGCFSKVLVYKTDRLSRNIPNIVKLVLETLIGMDIAFASITEPYDTSTPAGRMFFTQLASFADFERETIRERSMGGKIRKIKEGKWIGVCPHYAYRKDENKKLVPNPDTLPYFRMMVEWILEGESTWKVAKRLDRMGVPTGNQINNRVLKNGLYKWYPWSVRHIITNPVITGKATYAGIELEVDPVVTPEEYALIKIQLEKNKNNSGNAPSRFYLLQNLLYCKRCHHKLYCQEKRNKRRKNYVWKGYYCPSGRYPNQSKSCELKSIGASKIDEFIWKLAKNMVLDSKKLWKAVDARNIDLSVNDLCTDEELRLYDEKLRKLEREKSRLLSLFGKSEIITIEELEEKVGEIKTEISEVEAARVEILTRKDRILEKRKSLEKATDKLKSIRSRLDEFSDTEKRKLIQLLISRITVDWDEEKQECTIDVEVQVPIFRDEDKDEADSASFILEELKSDKQLRTEQPEGQKVAPRNRQSYRDSSEVIVTD